MVMQPSLPFDRPTDASEPLPDFAAPPTPRPLDPEWQRMLGIEPRLADLEARAAAGDDLGQLLHDLQAVCGWYCERPALRNAASFARACKALRAAALWRQVTPLPKTQGGRR